MPLPAFLYLSAEQKACLGGEGKVESHIFVQIKEQLLFFHRGFLEKSSRSCGPGHAEGWEAGGQSAQESSEMVLWEQKRENENQRESLGESLGPQRKNY